MKIKQFLLLACVLFGTLGLGALGCKGSDGGNGGRDADNDTNMDADTDRDRDRDTDIARDADQDDEYGMHLFVKPDAASGGNGSIDAPFKSLWEAREAVRTQIAAGIPENGIVVWLREGVYQLNETFVLNADDAGQEGRPIVWRGYPGENVRVSGGVAVDVTHFESVTSSSPVWERLDVDARDHILQMDLHTQGVTDYGSLTRRGFCEESGLSPVELFVNSEPMTLSRWPDRNEGSPYVDPTGETVEVFGTTSPDVSGTYTRIGENDGVSVFQKDTLVGGDQFYLYRYYWFYSGSWFRAWFLTTDESGYPTSNGPWWYLYNDDLGPMNPSTSNGATGNPIFSTDGVLRNGFAYIAANISDTVWTYSGIRPDRWTEAEEVWFHGWWKFPWADCRVAATNIDTASRTVTLSDTTRYGISAGQPYYAFNLLEEITVPGEYYIDRNNGMLYFYPPPDTDLTTAQVVISILDDYLMDLDGTSYVEIHDVIFEAGRFHLVRINGGNANLLNKVILRNSGGRGISISGTANGIRNCTISNTATGGVELSGGDRLSLTSGDNFVENCEIHDFGRIEWAYRPAVKLQDVGQRVEHNLIHSAPHSAILFGGNEHRIALNEIHTVCQYSSDAGAIYAGRDWGFRGNVIENNFIHHINTKFAGHGVHGIYLDDCLSGITVFGNVLYEIQHHAILHGGGRDNLMDNNIMVNNGDAIYADSRCYDWRSQGVPNNIPGNAWNLLEKLNNVGYQDEPWASAYPECAAIPNDWDAIIAEGATWTYPEGCTFNRNLGFNNKDWMLGGRTYNHYASIVDNVANADPLFVDETNLDLTLSVDSPALAIPGFVDIPFGEIGIQVE